MTTIESSFNIDRKQFHLSVGENRSGHFLKIKEINARGSNLVVIPLEGVSKFKDELDGLVKQAYDEKKLSHILDTTMHEYFSAKLSSKESEISQPVS